MIFNEQIRALQLLTDEEKSKVLAIITEKLVGNNKKYNYEFGEAVFTVKGGLRFLIENNSDNRT
jgi:hypothetical protein